MASSTEATSGSGTILCEHSQQQQVKKGFKFKKICFTCQKPNLLDKNFFLFLYFDTKKQCTSLAEKLGILYLLS